MKTALPHRRLLSQAEVFRHLGRGIAEDCIAAGWLKHRAAKPGKSGPGIKIFDLKDVLTVEERILNEGYPTK